MPHHLAIHKVVTNVAPHESPVRNEFHTQQSIHRGSVSAKQIKKKRVSVRVATLLPRVHRGYSDSSSSSSSSRKLRHLLSIPEESDEAREGDRGVRGLQSGHQHPSLPPAIRAGGVGPSFRQRVPAQTCVHVRQDDRQRSVHEKDLPRQPRRFDGKVGYIEFSKL